MRQSVKVCDVLRAGCRAVPRLLMEDPKWAALLSAQDPPLDGLYIPRASFLDSQKTLTSRNTKKQKPVSEMSNMEILKTIFKNGLTPKKTEGGVNKSMEAAGQTQQSPLEGELDHSKDKSLADLALDWNSLSPDDESSILGLEELNKGETIAIVGAGITGLTLAWAVACSRPDVNVRVYESNSRVGGWVESESVPGAVFESGPRTLLPSHPGTPIILDMLNKIDQLGILNGVRKTAPTNRKGLVFGGKLHTMPTSLFETFTFLLRSPLLQGVKCGLLKELFTPTRPSEVNDESVSNFLQRRFGATLDERLVSAVFRGIYGASTKELSARTVVRFSQLYYLERTRQSSSVAAALTGSAGYLDACVRETYPLLFRALTDSNPADVDMNKYSLYAFSGGMSTFPEALKKALQQLKNVELRVGVPVKRLKPDPRKVIIYTDKGIEKADVTVVTTCAAPIFAEDCPGLSSKIAAIDHTSLAVVNVQTPEPIAKDWFGVLVPRAEDDNNPEGVLGIIFDSSVRAAAEPLATIGRGSKKRKVASETVSLSPIKGSSVTVMLGGDLWDNPTESEARERALSALQRLLGPFEPSKATVKVRLQRNCIPTPHPGHSALVHEAHAQARRGYKNRVALCGMALGRGIGISECILDATLVASRFSPVRKALHPRFFFGEWLAKTRPELFA